MIDAKTITAGIGALAAVGAFWGGYWVASVSYTADIAAARQSAAEEVARQSAAARLAEREAEEIRSEMETVYLQLDQERHENFEETRRLERSLSDAVSRMRGQSAVAGGPGLSGASDPSGGCADVRSANRKLAGALERIVAGGGAIAFAGQAGIDVASTCAEWAGKIGGRP
ncbi:hypothetical protein FACS1894205_2110 [Alphaproteobacteria bacterium]|nr:hypothetical protein FACS1894205_2110 [Alphaproteobacteria bacterium]